MNWSWESRICPTVTVCRLNMGKTDLHHLGAHPCRWHILIGIDVDSGGFGPLSSRKIQEHNFIDNFEFFVGQILSESAKNCEPLKVQIDSGGHVGHGHDHVIAVSRLPHPGHSLKIKSKELIRDFLIISCRDRVTSKDVQSITIDSASMTKTR